MALQRRMLLQSVIGVGVGLAGCISLQGSEGTNAETPTHSAEPNPQARETHVVIHNHTSGPVTVSVELSTEGTILLEDETTIEQDEFTSLGTGINEEGQYKLAIAVDDREEENGTFDIGEDNLDTGSNIIVWIYEDDVQFGIED